MDKSLEDMLIEAAESKRAKEEAAKLDSAQKSEAVTKSDLASLFLEMEQRLDQKIQKAIIQDERGTGVGRKGPITDERDADPVGYLVKKSADPEKLTVEDKVLMGAITNAALKALFPINITHYE